jgi:membrane associated rhomboid family serine protease
MFPSTGTGWLLPVAVVSTTAILVFGATPTGFSLLTLDSHRVVSGEPWRLLTCQFAHYGIRHAVQNVLAVVALMGVGTLLGVIGEMVLACGFSLVAIPAAILLSSRFELFAGMSGIGVSLATVCALTLARERRKLLSLLPIIALVAYLAMPRAPLADASEVATEAHWAGFVAGAGVVWFASRYRPVPRSSSSRNSPSTIAEETNT